MVNLKNALIIRSASFQQLDKNFPAIEEALPDHRFQMLTHEHGVKLAEKYKLLSKIYVYPYKQSFSFWRPVQEFKDQKFDCVIVPVSNLTGAGFLNVLLFSLTINAKKRYICNLISDLRPVSMVSIIGMGARSLLISAISVLVTVLLAVPLTIGLPMMLRRLKKK
ncbi:hypothetical protein P9314_11085 [Paenibacillus validus]|uniref:hypothetical protein n=1 Tax=Paenibacillus TaxID=44249 RepID=UPI001F175C8B|nr:MULTISPECIES: hypothetical protein [Paenibacillus]MED4601249.1 hypothetical protein [Paenibacillus validus]MED4605454.1 hypothetical protein [Paenibacillus validus]